MPFVSEIRSGSSSIPVIPFVDRREALREQLEIQRADETTSPSGVPPVQDPLTEEFKEFRLAESIKTQEFIRIRAENDIRLGLEIELLRRSEADLAEQAAQDQAISTESDVALAAAEANFRDDVSRMVRIIAIGSLTIDVFA